MGCICKRRVSLKVAIIGSRGYPYVYSGYETFVKELSERLCKKGVDVTVYCHKGLFSERPQVVNGINLRYIPSIEKCIDTEISLEEELLILA